MKKIGANVFDNCLNLNAIKMYCITPPACGTSFSNNQYISLLLQIPPDTQSEYARVEPWCNFWNIEEDENLLSEFVLFPFKYDILTENTVKVGGFLDESVSDCIIPAYVEYRSKQYEVTDIGFAGTILPLCEKVELPYTIKNLPSKVFKNWTKLKTISFGECVTIGSEALANCKSIESIIIPETCELIGQDCFSGCSSLKNLVIADSDHSLVIGNSAFKDCTLLDSISIPSSVTSIGIHCFSGCSSLKNLVIADSDHSLVIGDFAFKDCTRLDSISIPSSVTSIGILCFSGCISLKNLFFADSDRPIQILTGRLAVDEKNLLTTIDGMDVYYDLAIIEGNFNGLPIENLYIGRNLSSEDSFIIIEGGRFVDVANAKYYNVTILEEPFSKLPKLKNLTIGANVCTLGSQVREIEEVGLLLHTGSFERCDAIKNVSVNASVPPTGAIFSETVYSNASLNVPENTKANYQEADGWKEFKNIFDGTEPVLVGEIRLNVTDVSLKVGDTFQLTAEVLPENATDPTVIWDSSNPECVSVDKNGLITALTEGTATILARSDDGNCEASCLVTVNPEEDSVETIDFNGATSYTVYNLQGIKILNTDDVDKLKHLPSGVYFVNGKKIVIK